MSGGEGQSAEIDAIRLAIADPPYPPSRGIGGVKPRSSRWYGDNQRSATDRPSDNHPQARVYDDPANHRALLERLMDEYDGWAIATAPDGLQAYGTLPLGTRILSWVKPNAQPGSHRLRSTWEPIIVFPPITRVSNRGGVGQMGDVLVAPAPGGFIGAKPAEWTRFVLDALGHVAGDVVDDLFRGSGAVAAALAQPELELVGCSITSPGPTTTAHEAAETRVLRAETVDAGPAA